MISRNALLTVCMGLICISGAIQAKTVSGMAHTDFDSTMGIPQVALRCICSLQGGATVTLYDTAGDDGSFVIGGVSAQCTSVRLKASKLGYATVDTTIALAGDSVFVTFPMEPSIFGEAIKVVKGRFMVQGAGAANVAFRFYAYGLGSPIIFYDTTGSDGAFEITGIQGGCNLGWIRTEDDASSTADTTFPLDGDTTIVTISAHSAVSVRSPRSGDASCGFYQSTAGIGFGVNGRRIFSAAGRSSDLMRKTARSIIVMQTKDAKRVKSGISIVR
jgi:hypothetical protein